MIPNEQSNYDTDFVQWALKQAQLVREGRFNDVDIENVAEEIESLARSDRRALRSHLRVMSEHFIKLQVFPRNEPRRGWIISARNAAREVQLLLDESPSLNAVVESLYTSEFIGARQDVEFEYPEYEASAVAVPDYREVVKALERIPVSV